MKRKVLIALSWLAVALLCIFIFQMSGTVAEESSEQSTFLITLVEKIFGVTFTDFVIRKFAHMFEFAALGFFAAIAFCYSFKSIKKVYFSIPFCFLYAISDEIHQRFVPGRAGQIRDVFIDLAGIIIGTFLIVSVYLLFKKCRVVKGFEKRNKSH